MTEGTWRIQTNNEIMDACEKLKIIKKIRAQKAKYQHLKEYYKMERRRNREAEEDVDGGCKTKC